MPWKEVSTGKYARTLDNAELLLKTVATPFKAINREHWAVNFIARVSLNAQGIEEATEAIKGAWIALRYYHPHIAAILEEDVITYEVPDEHSLKNWISESFFIQNEETVDEYLFSATWMQYASIHFFPKSSEIVLRVHHWLVDGMGSQHLANRFLELLAEGGNSPSFGGEIERLPPSLQEALGFSPEVSVASQKGATDMFLGFVGNMPSIGLPTDISRDTPGGTLCSALEYPPTILASLLRTCHDRGLSVTALVHAAIVVATQELHPASSPAKNYTTFAMFDYRPYLPKPFNDVSAWPMGDYMLGLPLSLPPAEITVQAKELHSFYKQPLAIGELKTLEYYDQYAGMMAAALSQPPPPGMPLPTTPSLSGLGAMERRLRHKYEGKYTVEIKQTALRSDVMAPPLAMYQWSWQGHFTINACYNEAYYSKESIDKFMTRVEKLLLHEIGA